MATVASRNGNAKGVYVETHDQTTGGFLYEPFHVVTYCGAKPSYAVVGAGLSLVRYSHVTFLAHAPGSGVFRIGFDHGVRKCATTASIGSEGGGVVASPGQITVGFGDSFNSNIFVYTFSRAGVATDFPFHVAVDCGATALVGGFTASGSTAWGTNVASSARLSTGKYEVIFNRNVSACAYTATVSAIVPGDAVTDAVTISTASRTAQPNGVLVSIHNVSGADQDEPFQLHVTC